MNPGPLDLKPGALLLVQLEKLIKIFFSSYFSTHFPPTGPSASFPCRLASNDWGQAAKWAQLLITTNCWVSNMGKIEAQQDMFMQSYIDQTLRKEKIFHNITLETSFAPQIFSSTASPKQIMNFKPISSNDEDYLYLVQ